jgi:hypothetical protein
MIDLTNSDNDNHVKLEVESDENEKAKMDAEEDLRKKQEALVDAEDELKAFVLKNPLKLQEIEILKANHVECHRQYCTALGFLRRLTGTGKRKFFQVDGGTRKERQRHKKRKKTDEVIKDWFEATYTPFVKSAQGVYPKNRMLMVQEAYIEFLLACLLKTMIVNKVPNTLDEFIELLKLKGFVIIYGDNNRIEGWMKKTI